MLVAKALRFEELEKVGARAGAAECVRRMADLSLAIALARVGRRSNGCSRGEIALLPHDRGLR
jgi:hypothetical protein